MSFGKTAGAKLALRFLIGAAVGYVAFVGIYSASGWMWLAVLIFALCALNITFSKLWSEKSATASIACHLLYILIFLCCLYTPILFLRSFDTKFIVDSAIHEIEDECTVNPNYIADGSVRYFFDAPDYENDVSLNHFTWCYSFTLTGKESRWHIGKHDRLENDEYEITVQVTANRLGKVLSYHVIAENKLQSN